MFMQQAQQVKEMILKLSEIADETPTVKSFKAELPEGTGVDFYPGQFFMVSFPGDAEIKTARAYSVASSPMEKKYLEIALNKIGPFTTKMFQLKPGDLLFWTGTYPVRRDPALSHVMLYIGRDKNNRPLMFGATERRLANKTTKGVGVFPFNLPSKNSKIRFLGYACIPHLTCA